MRNIFKYSYENLNGKLIFSPFSLRFSRALVIQLWRITSLFYNKFSRFEGGLPLPTAGAPASSFLPQMRTIFISTSNYQSIPIRSIAHSQNNWTCNPKKGDKGNKAKCLTKIVNFTMIEILRRFFFYKETAPQMSAFGKELLLGIGTPAPPSQRQGV